MSSLKPNATPNALKPNATPNANNKTTSSVASTDAHLSADFGSDHDKSLTESRSNYKTDNAKNKPTSTDASLHYQTTSTDVHFSDDGDLGGSEKNGSDSGSDSLDNRKFCQLLNNDNSEWSKDLVNSKIKKTGRVIHLCSLCSIEVVAQTIDEWKTAMSDHLLTGCLVSDNHQSTSASTSATSTVHAEFFQDHGGLSISSARVEVAAKGKDRSTLKPESNNQNVVDLLDASDDDVEVMEVKPITKSKPNKRSRASTAKLPATNSIKPRPKKKMKKKEQKEIVGPTADPITISSFGIPVPSSFASSLAATVPYLEATQPIALPPQYKPIEHSIQLQRTQDMIPPKLQARSLLDGIDDEAPTSTDMDIDMDLDKKKMVDVDIDNTIDPDTGLVTVSAEAKKRLRSLPKTSMNRKSPYESLIMCNEPITMDNFDDHCMGAWDPFEPHYFNDPDILDQEGVYINRKGRQTANAERAFTIQGDLLRENNGKIEFNPAHVIVVQCGPDILGDGCIDELANVVKTAKRIHPRTNTGKTQIADTIDHLPSFQGFYSKIVEAGLETWQPKREEGKYSQHKPKRGIFTLIAFPSHIDRPELFLRTPNTLVTDDFWELNETITAHPDWASKEGRRLHPGKYPIVGCLNLGPPKVMTWSYQSQRVSMIIGHKQQVFMDVIANGMVSKELHSCFAQDDSATVRDDIVDPRFEYWATKDEFKNAPSLAVALAPLILTTALPKGQPMPVASYEPIYDRLFPPEWEKECAERNQKVIQEWEKPGTYRKGPGEHHARICNQTLAKEEMDSHVPESGDYVGTCKDVCRVDMRPVSLWRESKWLYMLDQLKDYKSKNGDCFVPSSFVENQKLARWVICQRHLQGKGILSKDRFIKLDEIGFDWVGRDYDADWRSTFEKLKAYKEVHGNCIVSKSYTQYSQLAVWVSRQRHQYRSGSMPKDRIETLNSVGFEWEVESTRLILRPDVFDEWIEKLKAYKAKHGDCNVPIKEGKLGEWCASTRYQLKKKPIQDRIEKLNEIGFEWNPPQKSRNYRNGTYSLDPEVWDPKYEELKAYHAEHGDCNVPQGKSGKLGKLGNWVNYQRQACKKGKLTKDRVDKLNELGFEWIRKKGPKKGTVYRKRKRA